MSRPKIIKILKEKNPKLHNKDLEDTLDIFSEIIINGLKDRKRIELRDFGIFFVKKLSKKASARNPRTSEIIYVPEKNKVRFKASKKLKKIINNEKY